MLEDIPNKHFDKITASFSDISDKNGAFQMFAMI